MGKLSHHARRLRAVLALVSLAALLAAPAAALADRGRGCDNDDGDERGRSEHLTCGSTETLVNIDEQVCHANSRRGVVIHHRKCCKNKAGRVHCDHFEHCPHNSPS
jgi:hypothetical protein